MIKKLNSIIKLLFIFLLFAYFFSGCLTVKFKDGKELHIREYKEVTCPTCGFINVAYKNDRYIKCQRCGRILSVSW